MDSIDRIEKTYKVEDLLERGEKIWPIMRIPISFFLHEKKSSPKKAKVPLLSKINFRLKNLFYGLSKTLNKCDVLFICNSMPNKFFEKKEVNSLFFTLYEKLKKYNLAYLERPTPKHPPRDKNGNPNTFSSSIIDLIAHIYGFLCKPQIINNEQLRKIQQEIGLTQNLTLYLGIFRGYCFCARILIKIKKPKIIFLSEYYTPLCLAFIYEAKKLGIKTIELQHGVINREHFAYAVNKKINSSFYPDNILVYGEYFKNVLGDNSYIPNNNFRIFGHPFIYYSMQNNKKLSRPTYWNSYKAVINVTLQYINEDMVIDFINKTAELNSDCLFLLIRRNNVLRTKTRFSFPKNVVLENNFDFYQCASLADVHMTHSSTCAVEAPVFGQPNILIATNDIPKKYYSDLLSDEEVTKFISSPDDFKIAIDELLSKKDRVRKNFDKIIYSDHESKINELIKDLPI